MTIRQAGWILARDFFIALETQPKFSELCRRLETPTVDLLHCQLVGIDVVDAAHVDRHHLRTVRPLAARKRLDAAGRAEQVMDVVPVELVFGGRAFALQQLEV